MQDHYSVLGVSATATDAEIRKAYHKLALTYHPDKNPDADPSKFNAVSEAYSVLSDKTKRATYDAERSQAAEGPRVRTSMRDMFSDPFHDFGFPSFGGPGDPFEEIFGRAGAGGPGAPFGSFLFERFGSARGNGGFGSSFSSSFHGPSFTDGHYSGSRSRGGGFDDDIHDSGRYDGRGNYSRTSFKSYGKPPSNGHYSHRGTSGHYGDSGFGSARSSRSARANETLRRHQEMVNEHLAHMSGGNASAQGHYSQAYTQPQYAMGATPQFPAQPTPPPQPEQLHPGQPPQAQSRPGSSQPEQFQQGQFQQGQFQQGPPPKTRVPPSVNTPVEEERLDRTKSEVIQRLIDVDRMSSESYQSLSRIEALNQQIKPQLDPQTKAALVEQMCETQSRLKSLAEMLESQVANLL